MSGLKIARGFSLPEGYITKTAAILAKKRIGKTYNASVIAEEFVRVGLPFVALDPTSAWWGLRASEDGQRDGLPVTIIGGEHGDLPLDVQSGKAIADLVVEEPGFYVVDLGHWESDSEHRRWAAPFLDRVYRLKAKGQHRDPLHLFIDEADVFAPQKPQKGDEQMLHNMQAIVRRGGIRGLGTTLITQRAAVLNKDVLTQLDLLIILRTIAPNDQDAVEDYIKRGASEQRAEIMASLASLKAGEAWIYGPGEEPPLAERVQFRARRTFNSSATPDGKARVEPKKMAPVDLDKARARLAESIERAKADDPSALRRQLATARKKITQLEARKPDKEPAPEPERIEVPVISGEQLERLDSFAAKVAADVADLRAAVDSVTDAIGVARRGPELQGRRNGQRASAQPTPARRATRGRPAPPPRAESPREPATDGDFRASASQQRVLDTLAWFEALGIDAPQRAALAPMAGSKATSGGFKNNLGVLRTAGLVEYPTGGRVALTAAGRALADPPDVEPTAEALQEAVLNAVTGAQAAILEVLIDAYPADLARDELADAVGVPVTSGGFKNNLGALRTLELVDYPAGGHVVALPVLFPAMA